RPVPLTRMAPPLPAPPLAPSPPTPPVAWLSVNVLWLRKKLASTRGLVVDPSRIAPLSAAPPSAPSPPAPPVAWLPVKVQEMMLIAAGPSPPKGVKPPPPAPAPPPRPGRPAPPVARLAEKVLSLRRSRVQLQLRIAPPWPAELFPTRPPAPPTLSFSLKVL